MVSSDSAVSSTFQTHPIFLILALVVLGIALLVGLLHEITFALEVLRMLVARVKDHLRKLFAAARDLWAELTTWKPPAPPPNTLSNEGHDNGAG